MLLLMLVPGGGLTADQLSGSEFVRRVLQHVLPKGFQRVRHYGWLGAAAKARRERIAALLDWRAPALVTPLPLLPPKCPGCGQVMRLIGSVARKPP